MKKIFSIILTISIFCVLLTGCFVRTTTHESEIEDTVVQEEEVVIETEEANLFSEIGEVTCELAIDYNGNDCALITIPWTNLGSDTEEFSMNYIVTVYQNGVEVDNILFLEDWQNDNILNSGMTKIRPNTSIDIYKVFAVNIEEPFEVEITEAFNFNNDDAVVYNFNLSNN